MKTINHLQEALIIAREELGDDSPLTLEIAELLFRYHGANFPQEMTAKEILEREA